MATITTSDPNVQRARVVGRLTQEDVIRAVRDITSDMRREMSEKGASPQTALASLGQQYAGSARQAKTAEQQLQLALRAAISRYAERVAMGRNAPDVRALVLALDADDDGHLSPREIRAIYSALASDFSDLPLWRRPEEFREWAAELISEMPTWQKVLLAAGVPFAALGAISTIFSGPNAGNMLAMILGGAAILIPVISALTAKDPVIDTTNVRSLAEDLELLSFSRRPEVRQSLSALGVALRPQHAQASLKEEEKNRLIALENRGIQDIIAGVSPPAIRAAAAAASQTVRAADITAFNRTISALQVAANLGNNEAALKEYAAYVDKQRAHGKMPAIPKNVSSVDFVKHFSETAKQFLHNNGYPTTPSQPVPQDTAHAAIIMGLDVLGNNGDLSTDLLGEILGKERLGRVYVAAREAQIAANRAAPSAKEEVIKLPPPAADPRWAGFDVKKQMTGDASRRPSSKDVGAPLPKPSVPPQQATPAPEQKSAPSISALPAALGGVNVDVRAPTTSDWSPADTLKTVRLGRLGQPELPKRVDKELLAVLGDVLKEQEKQNIRVPTDSIAW